jgi:hypothetical protein
LHPVSYLPSTGDLTFYPDLTVSVSLRTTGTVDPAYRGLPVDRVDVAAKVDNPQIVASYTAQAAAEGGSRLLILTTPELADSFIPLKEAHDALGLPTVIKTLTDVSAAPGTVTPDRIRSFLRSEYTDGIEYVLLGGDLDVIPAQYLWVKAWTGGDTTQMPSDLFYECLDGTYDYDDDDLYGEPTDGDGGADVDLLGDVSVGRACVGSTTEADAFVAKTVDYLIGDPYASGPALMVGELLWEDPDTYGDTYMEELVNGSSAHNYVTVGIPAGQYTIDRLYDTLGGWDGSDLIARVNSGTRLINHLGHSSSDYNMRIQSSQVDNMQNTMIPFIYSQGCHAGAFDEGDCIAEHWTTKTTHGAFAVIMCARYGWGVVGSTDGANQRFHRQFWDAVFSENITSLGKANQDSKEDNLKKIAGACMRWVYYEMNLFGDPALEIFPTENTAPQQPAAPTGTPRGGVGTNYTYTAVTNDADGDLLYYQFSFGDGTFSPWLGPYESGQELSVNHSWARWGHYSVTVKARDEHRLESPWSEPLPVVMPFAYQHPVLSFLLWLLQLISDTVLIR